ncbi:MAG: RMD1 family protein [Deltaproteobacteria bacterium]|nr:RMD1 family protein [Deltaproteobacteria bacterium]
MSIESDPQLAPLIFAPEYVAHAMFVGERIDVSELENLAAETPTVVPIDRGCAVLFRYGAVVFFDVAPAARLKFLSQITELISDPFAEPEQEEVILRVDPESVEHVAGRVFFLRESSAERLQLVATVLGKSVVLGHYENSLATVFDRVEPLVTNLAQRGRAPWRSRRLLEHIADSLQIQHKMIGRAEVTEKPELLWERPHLERTYLRLADEFELYDRNLAIARKLALISSTAQTVLELLHNRRSLRVEWYIVILIVVEIVLTLSERI